MRHVTQMPSAANNMIRVLTDMGIEMETASKGARKL
jgi:hypothetical protein